MQFVTYLRVSTDRQGVSGLGLEAQRAAVASFVSGRGDVIAEYVEVESGKKSDRPQIAAALAYAKKAGAVLLIAKLDRLARNVAFIANLLESNVEIMAADLPEANRFLLHIMAAVAEEEGRAISERTRAALKAAKERGVKLGAANPAIARHRNVKAMRAAISRKAISHAAEVLPVIDQIKAAGATTLRQIAAALNVRGIRTANGGKWYPTTVKNIIDKEGRVRGHA